MSETVAATSEYNTVTNTSQELGTPMIPGFQYRLATTTNMFFKIGATGTTTAAAADDSHILGAGQSVLIAALSATVKYVAVIRDTADGHCTLSPVIAGCLP